MRRLPCFFALWAATSGLAAPASPAAGPAPLTAREVAQGHRDGVVLAQPRATHRATVAADEAREGLRVRKHFPRFGELRVLELPAGDTPARAVARLQATGRYEFVERDMLRFADATPNDPRFSEQWSLNNTGLNNGIPGADISAPAAWDTRTDASSVIVAVIDSGVRLTHPDIAANLWGNPRELAGNGVDDDGNGYIDDVNGINALIRLGQSGGGNPTDDHGHGSHVAGIIGAVGNNGTGIAGVAWKVQIMALKGLGSTGTGSISDLVECIDYAIANGAHLINASYGAAAATSGQGFSSSELTAIRRARDAGIIFVAATGNDATDLELSPHYPASHRVDNVIAVGNITNRDDLSGSSSNFGSGSVELFAPGTAILSLGYTTDTGTNAYVVKSGTSMSAPHVVGALALLKAQFPTDTCRQLINRLLRAVDPLATLTGKCQTGGRLNLARAITSAPNDNRPFNDDFATRAKLVGGNFLIRSSNAGATPDPQPGEPAILGNAASASLWWEWMPTLTAPVRLSTAGSSYDTLVAVYAGTALNNLTLVTANDDDVGTTTSRLEFTAQAGVTHQIKIDGKNGASGPTFMDIGVVPANDAFASAEALAGRTLRLDAANANCTREAGEPRILGFAGGKSLWYRWTAPASGRFQVAVTSNGFDPLLAVYTGSSLVSLTLVGANDNTGANNAQTGSLVTVNATAGATYYFQVDGKEASATTPPPNGALTLTINDSLWQAATGDSLTCAPAVAPDGSVYIGSIDQSFYAFNADGTQRWAVPVSGLLDTASAAVATDGTVYAASSGATATTGTLYAFNPATGAIKWSLVVGSGANLSNAISLAADGTIYVRSYDGYLYAFTDAGSTATQQWRAAVPGAVGTASYASVSIAPDGTIYLGADDNKLYALNPDGTQKWTFLADNQIFTAPALDGAGNLYFGVLSSGKLFSLAPDGTQRWVYSGAALGTSSSPALSPDGGTVYFAAYDAKLHAVNTATGTARWAFTLGKEVRASSPAVDANGVIYVGCYDGLLYAVNPDGTPKRTWATANWIRSSPALAGTTLYVGSNDGKLYAFDIGVSAASGPWPQFHHNARRLGRAVTDTLGIATQPASQIAVLGTALTLSVAATGQPTLTYQWRKDGVPVAGATAANYTVPAVTAATAGAYTVVVTGPQGTITSAPAVVVVEPPDPGRLVNLSVRAAADPARPIIAGFVVRGGSRPMLIRAVGPGLQPLLPAGFIVAGDPRMEFYDAGETLVDANDNWAPPGTAKEAALNTVFNRVGAFPLPSGSLDAAVAREIDGASTAHLRVATAGIALLEVYDVAPSPTTQTAVAVGASDAARLVNLSARSQVGTGANILIAGFVISGNLPRTFLIRGVGPSLAQLNLAGLLANPLLRLFRGDNQINLNDDWFTAENAAAIQSTAVQVGAFAFTGATSRDAALLVTLAPGIYSAQVSGLNNTTGTALVEVYEVP